MWDKLASVMGSGVSDALKAVKELIIDTWHIDPAKAMELEQKSREIEAAIQAKQAEEMTKLQHIDAQDRNSARQREIALKDKTPSILAFVLVGGFLSLTGFLIVNLTYLHYEIPGPAMGMIGTLIGYLAGEAKAVSSYFFGSSAGSAAKQQHIENLTK